MHQPSGLDNANNFIDSFMGQPQITCNQTTVSRLLDRVPEFGFTGTRPRIVSKVIETKKELYGFHNIQNTDNKSTLHSSTASPSVSPIEIEPPVIPNLLNNSDKFDHLLYLEKFLKTKKPNLFFTEIDKIDWRNQPPKSFIYTIRLALEIPSITIAQKLCGQGIKLYPENTELQKFSQVLEKPNTPSYYQIDINIQANNEWIMNNGENYKGHWVALKNGSLLGTSQSLKMLVSNFHDRENIYFTKVY